ncbi:MAG: hypothetical protein KAS32_03725, partial [Candidatus Peribacteraceae bacterium]|nr:hypothetical protein [Candidatus Peribacteraceae bacterium]
MSLGFPCSNLHNPVLCIPDNSYNNMWGYVIGDYNCIIRRKTHNVIKPFWYRSIPNKTINPVVYTARLENLYVSKRKPFNKYTHYITENIKLRPLKEDFIVIRQSSILKLLEKLALEYKYQYVIRKAPQKNILPALTSSSSIKDIHLICSIFRVHDVLPSDINNTDGLCIKIHDGNYEYVDIVFSDNKNMYNTDG